MVRVYLAGPMAGRKDWNRPAFEAVAEWLRAMRFDVVSPLELDDEHGLVEGTDVERFEVGPLARAAYLRRDFGVLMTCERICLLPGWTESRGANAELVVAQAAGLGVMTVRLDAEDRPYLLALRASATPDLGVVEQHLQEVAEAQGRGPVRMIRRTPGAPHIDRGDGWWTKVTVDGVGPV